MEKVIVQNSNTSLTHRKAKPLNKTLSSSHRLNIVKSREGYIPSDIADRMPSIKRNIAQRTFWDVLAGRW